MGEREVNQILAGSFLGFGFLMLCLAALIERRWKNAADTFGIVAIAMFVMAFIMGVTNA